MCVYIEFIATAGRQDFGFLCTQETQREAGGSTSVSEVMEKIFLDVRGAMQKSVF